MTASSVETFLLGFLDPVEAPALPNVLEAIREAVAIIDAHETDRRQFEAAIVTELEQAKALGCGVVLDLRPGSMSVQANHLVVANSAIIITPPDKTHDYLTPSGTRL